MLQSMGLQTVGHDLVTVQQQILKMGIWQPKPLVSVMPWVVDGGQRMNTAYKQLTPKKRKEVGKSRKSIFFSPHWPAELLFLHRAERDWECSVGTCNVAHFTSTSKFAQAFIYDPTQGEFFEVNVHVFMTTMNLILLWFLKSNWVFQSLLYLFQG